MSPLIQRNAITDSYYSDEHNKFHEAALAALQSIALRRAVTRDKHVHNMR